MRKETGHSQTHKDMEKRFKINELLPGFLVCMNVLNYLFICLYSGFHHVKKYFHQQMYFLGIENEVCQAFIFKTLTRF